MASVTGFTLSVCIIALRTYNTEWVLPIHARSCENSRVEISIGNISIYTQNWMFMQSIYIERGMYLRSKERDGQTDTQVEEIRRSPNVLKWKCILACFWLCNREKHPTLLYAALYFYKGKSKPMRFVTRIKRIELVFTFVTSEYVFSLLPKTTWHRHLFVNVVLYKHITWSFTILCVNSYLPGSSFTRIKELELAF